MNFRTKGKRKPKFVSRQITLLIGTSIMPVHGQEGYKDLPYEILKGRTYDNKEITQETNRLKYIPFNRSKRNDDESKDDHIKRDLKAHTELVEAAIKQYTTPDDKGKTIEVYALDKVQKTSYVVKKY